MIATAANTLTALWAVAQHAEHAIATYPYPPPPHPHPTTGLPRRRMHGLHDEADIGNARVCHCAKRHLRDHVLPGGRRRASHTRALMGAVVPSCQSSGEESSNARQG